MTNMMSNIPLLPGAVGLTHLRVYDTVAPDGLHGGSPHLHFACTECYYAIQGHGRVQTLSAAGYQEFTLEPGGVVWFSPGVIHRLINLDDRLEIFVVMQNAGLPEAGDFVLTLPPEILHDPQKYFEVASLSALGEVFTSTEAAAYRRRDLAVEGFAVLRRRFEEIGEAALHEFYETAVHLIEPKLEAWRNVWQSGPLAAAQATGEHLTALQAGDVSHLLHGAAVAMPPPGVQRKLGMCGTLGPYLPEGTTVTAVNETASKVKA
jgi:mannose-6-phosphate isomerase-like protein (cupin superfamily)